MQAHGATRAELNMHLTPSRDAEHLYQLKDGDKVEILSRATAEKNPPKAPKPAAVAPAKPGTKQKTKATASSVARAAAKPDSTAAASVQPCCRRCSSGRTSRPRPSPSWKTGTWCARSSGHAGWVLLRMVDLDIPLDIAQYAEGQRIIGYFVLNTVEEDGKPQPQYLVLLNEPKDGLV